MSNGGLISGAFSSSGLAASVITAKGNIVGAATLAATPSFNLDNIKVYYKFDETSGTSLENFATPANNFPDGTSTTNTGTNASETAVTVDVGGIIDKAFDYDFSADGYTNCGDNIFTSSGDFSFNMWLYHTLESAEEDVLIGGLNQGLAGWRASADKYRAGNTPYVLCTTTAPLNEWSMLSYTRSETTQTVYFNGTAEGSNTNSTFIAGGIWSIGGAVTDIGENWHGRVDELCVADRVFSADEITALYNSGVGLSLV